MTTDLITDPVRLADLAAKANTQHKLCLETASTAIQHARNCGQALIEAKSLCAHGIWQPWLRDNFHASARTARACMRIARHWPEIEAKWQSSAVLSIDQALRLIADSGDSEEDDLLDPTVEATPQARVPRSVRDPRLGRLPRPGHMLGGEASNGAWVWIEPHTTGGAYYLTIDGPETDDDGVRLAKFKTHEVRADLVYLQLEALDPRINYDAINWEEIPWPPHRGPHPQHKAQWAQPDSGNSRLNVLERAVSRRYAEPEKARRAIEEIQAEEFFGLFSDSMAGYLRLRFELSDDGIASLLGSCSQDEKGSERAFALGM